MSEQLSMSMFATRADYDAAVRAQPEQPTGLQLAVALLAQIGDDDSDRAIAAVHDLADEHAQRLALRHHAADLAQRVADLEAERDELRAKHEELLLALHGIGRALGIPEGDRSPYSVMCGVLERVNRLAEIEAQEPVAFARYSVHSRKPASVDLVSEYEEWQHDTGLLGDHWGGNEPLYARPVPAQAVPDASRAEAAGHEHAIGHLGALVEAQRLLLVDVEDICGRDGHGGQFEDGESEIIDRVRAHLATMAVPEAAR